MDDDRTVGFDPSGVGPVAVLRLYLIGRQTHVEEGATVEGSIVWPNGWIGPEAVLRGSILGRNSHVGRSATIESPAVLGDKTVIPDYSKI